MNDKLFRTILKRYEAAIADAKFKIHCINDHNMVIPEHVDITGEVDKQLEIIAANEDKIAVLRKYYEPNDEKTLL
jgi:limonene-1,2-epoxide hydrolase|tara:strand:- start:244 stop:468 length:225 start_codon:yes stop_codon:yes gene_type:complete